VLVFASCGKHASVSSALTAAEAQELTTAMNRLEAALQAYAPTQYASLSSGATSTEIGLLRAELNGSTVEVLEAWFNWHNGTTGGTCTLLPLGTVISIDEAIASRELEASIALIDSFRKSSFKILDDGSGDGFFINPTSSTPMVFYHMLEDPYPLYYGTLAEFIDFIAIGFEQGVMYEDPQGNFAYDMARYTTYETAHLAAVSAPSPSTATDPSIP
jgi:hypothetical protein